ncbi:coiled-coil domain-containing protein 125-like isoform X2 [Ptychodera flava]|uniref:coiled-coil domain-containing protein 125-like isoform X2 n=1 Tax=Ptychodera flava TaxID=63121 RepID=UPI003969DF07
MATVRRALSLPLPPVHNDFTDDGHRNVSADFEDSFPSAGDLGLGHGLKPGGLPKKSLENGQESADELSQTPCNVKKQRFGSVSFMESPKTNKTRRKSSRTGSDDAEEFPTFDGVPMGTSIRQQRKLYEHEIEEIVKTKGVLPSFDQELPATELTTKVNKVDQKAVLMKLRIAEEEVDILQNELEACKRQLDSKYRAIRILQSQALLAQAHQIQATVNTEVAKKKLEQDVNSLQFELELQSGNTMLSEETWADRFNKVCLENAALMTTLQARSDELKKIDAEKMAVTRERDELIAMMDVRERLTYEKHRSTTDSTYTENSIAELSILGACRCRVTNPEPCGCARAAAHLKKENGKLQDQIEEMKKSVEDSQVLADAYRMGFEEQLSRNRNLNRKVAEWLQRKQTMKAKKKGLGLMDKIEQLRNGNGNKVDKTQDSVTQSDQKVPSEADNATTVHDCTVPFEIYQGEDSDIVSTLAELLNDKCEALAHQKMVARMLARKTQDLEESVNKLTTADM